MMPTALNTTEDKGPKKGFYFCLETPERKDAVELCITADLGDGYDEELPLMVPTLTKEEIDHLLGGGFPTEEIIGKAVKFACERKMADKSVFPGPEEAGSYGIPD